ncbi:hypothetical protein [Gloeocapsopsis dulcis]|uniref:hypothetical protein n=1 Tax=Gloeocapsopsis dulcis TaxID=2859516 RepID=UPI001F3D6790|nr:hypothetical protein P0S91_00150 [Gloeocapsopsis dulcis]
MQSVTGAVGEGLISDLGGHFINTDHADMLELANEFHLRLFIVMKMHKNFPFLKQVTISMVEFALKRKLQIRLVCV